MKNELRTPYKVLLILWLACSVTFGVTSYAVLIPSGVATETRKSALTTGLVAYIDRDYSDVREASWVVQILNQLHSLYLLEQNLTIDYFSSQQNRSTGGFSSTLYPHYPATDLYFPACAVKALDILGALDQLNTSLLIQLVLNHYNSSSGAFFEPDGRCYFPLHYHTLEPAYTQDNIISTYLGLSILNTLDALDQINASQTTSWVWSCETQYGFKPQHPSILTSNFITDSYGTGLAYTYSAFQILQILGIFDQLSLSFQNRIIDYVWACESPFGGLCLTTEDLSYSRIRYTYYGIAILTQFNQVEKWSNNFTRLLESTLRYQWLAFYNILIPNPNWQNQHFESPFFLARHQNYGLFLNGYPLHDSFFATSLLADLEMDAILDTFTMRYFVAWQSLQGMALVLLAVIVSLFSISWIYWNRRT